ncbi:DUF6233 domain-containing protein [Streptomyces sp. NPDC058525]|uniref:DUF6233 domain-containing protein n=1 Tax=Streptomyces sp. NPDC058525 TaxID=3346538 RepID=UPI00366599EB
MEYPIGKGQSRMLLHTADCRLASGRTRPTTQEQALDALRQPQVEACSICLPPENSASLSPELPETPVI